MRSKDLTVGARVAVLSTAKIESYTRVEQYEVLSTQPWAATTRYGWRSPSTPEEKVAPEGVTLPEGVEWTNVIRRTPEDGWKSRGLGSTSPRALLVRVNPDGTYHDRPTLVPLGQIKGAFATVSTEVATQQRIMDDRARALRESRDRSRARFEAAKMDATERGLLPGYTSMNTSGTVSLSLEAFEALVSAASEARPVREAAGGSPLGFPER